MPDADTKDSSPASPTRPIDTATTVHTDNAQNLRCICGHDTLDDWGPCRPASVGARSPQAEHKFTSQYPAGRLYRCRHCALGLRLPQPDQEALTALYAHLPAERWKEDAPLSASQQYLVRRLSRHSNLRILDVGAFAGTFLHALPDSFEKYAIEPSAAADRLAARGISVLKPFLVPPETDEAGQFDVVTMFDVFEHLPDPIEAFNNLLNYVRPGGRVFIGTGNMDHWSWKLNRGDHWYLDPLQHICFGSMKHFQWLGHTYGAGQTVCRTFSHHSATAWQKCEDAATALYFGISGRSSWPAKFAKTLLVHTMPQLRRVAHKQQMPYTQHLTDHLLAEFVRSENMT